MACIGEIGENFLLAKISIYIWYLININTKKIQRKKALDIHTSLLERKLSLSLLSIESLKAEVVL